METKVSSSSKEVIISAEHPTVLIGERINPTGKKKMTEAVKSGNLEIICKEAVAQVAAGADIIDVNVSVADVDEVAFLPKAVQAVMEAVDVPLCIDSSNPEALVAALKVYRGKPLINSVSGEASSLEKILPVIKEYGAAVIGLTQDENGIPQDVKRRIEIAQEIVERAEAIGIPREDVVIDSLAMAVSAVSESGVVILDAIRKIKDELGVNQTLGASNVSFGLPGRELVNHAFLVAVIAAGVTCPIVDAAKVRSIVLAADLILDRDQWARRYITDYRRRVVSES